MKFTYDLSDFDARNAYFKIIPNIVMDSETENINIFLDAYTRGDGRFRKRKNGVTVREIFTSQKSLSDQLQILFLRSGVASTVRGNIDKEFNNFKYIVKEIIESEVDVKTKKIEKINYSGKVWCVETKP